MANASVQPVRVSFVATYPPRQCGIARFTYDLASGLAELYGESLGDSEVLEVVAVDKTPRAHGYGEEVRFMIREQHQKDYREAADHLNLSQTGVVSVQHEFGIFGGQDGTFILHLLEDLAKPVVTTLHTVLQQPDPGQAETLRAVCGHSSTVVVLSEKAVEFLTAIYGVPREKIAVIHHGVPDIPFLDPVYYKDEFQAEGRRVILSFGLLSPNKGLEVAIEALASVVREFPDVLYMIVGATHPEVKRQHGERYRVSLERMVKQLHLEEHVVFHNRFVSSEKLLDFLVAADICVIPYMAKEQIVSGALAYAVGCGNAIISTPFWYAEELLADENGCLVPFGDADAFAEELCDLLRDERKRQRLRKRTYQLGRQMTWGTVAQKYLEVFDHAVHEHRRSPAQPSTRGAVSGRLALPDVDLNTLWEMTDDTGLLQHCKYTIPSRSHGYCTDDNARAAIVTLMDYELFKDEGVVPMLGIYLSFLDHALDHRTGRVRNKMSYDRRWLRPTGSEDSQGRALWAFGTAVAKAPTESIRAFANERFHMALPACLKLSAHRARAYSGLGCLAYLERFRGDREVQDALRSFAESLFEAFEAYSSKKWRWCEDVVTYANARLPQLLIAGGQWLGEEPIWRQGLDALDWLLEVQTDGADGHISLVGSRGWYKRGGRRARFDQQPIEIAALVDACCEAYRATQDERWCLAMDHCFDWFFGENDLHEMVYHFKTGSCSDGLLATGINQNQGAESVVSWLLALHRMHEFARISAAKPGELEPQVASPR